MPGSKSTRQHVPHQRTQVTILLNKPVGYVSGQAEDGYEPAVVLIRPENRWSADPSPLKFDAAHLQGLAPRRAPGHRLDRSAGAHAGWPRGKTLIGQDSSVEKEYLVRVEGTLTDEGMRRLRHGPAARWRDAQACGGVLAERASAAFRAARGDASGRSAACVKSWGCMSPASARPQRQCPAGWPAGCKWRYLRPDEAF